MTDKELRSGEAAIVQKQADDALRDAAWRLESIIEGTHVGTWEWNVQTGETVYNEVWAQIIGYTLDELAPISIKTFQTFVHPDDLKQSDELLDRHFAGELPYYDYDCRMKHKDGHWVWVHDRGRVITRTGDGKPLMMFGTHTDITARKRAEEALVSSLSLLKATMESTADGILVVDLNGRITLWNHKFADMWRIPEELLSDHLDETALNYVLQELAQPEAFLAKVRELYGQPEESSNDQLDLADGRIFQRHSQPQRISDEVVGRVWSFSDITERKRAEDALRESEIKYRTLIEMTGTGYLILDSQGRVLDANQEYVRLSGHTRLHDILGKSVIAWTAEGAKQRNAEAIAQCARNGFIRDFVTEYVDGSGKITPVEINASVDGEGESSRIVSLCRDISERKQAEEEAQRERAFFDRLVETTPEGVAITDIQGRVMRVNAEFVRMFGYEVDEAVGQRIDDLVAPPERWEEASMITRSTGQGEKTLLETVRRRKDGTLVDVSLIAAPILIAGNQEAGYAIYRDITERKRAEAQLRQSQKMEAIGTLAGGVAHDFNNLLTGILGNIALMRSSLPPTDPLLENLTAAETSARQAADLTKGLLTFSHSAMVLPVPMSITTALDATLALLKQSLPATMEIVRDYEEKAWNILLDQSQVTQILLNLAVNARDAMKGKGTLTVRVRNEVVGEEYLQAHPFARAGEFVHLSVTDTGPGMSSEVMLHLFEPFYTTKPIGSGTGLGLSVVYGAVKQAGGWITAVSTEGVGRTAPQKYPSDWRNILGGIGQTCSGATFDIYLPRCLEEPRQSFAPSPLSSTVREGTVLVVEDEPVVCAVAQALLSRSGYTVLTAPDGASALNILHEHLTGIGLILLDMTMPGMTTNEIVQAVRAVDPIVPILLNSGYALGDTVAQMLEEGSVQGFLGKPYSLSELTDKVQELLQQS